MNMLKRKSRGSYTIEAVIVMSSVLMAIFAVFYSFMLMYQNVVVMYAASYGAQEGAAAWANASRDISGKEVAVEKNTLYDGIAELVGGGGMKNKKSDIEKCVKEKLKMGVYNVDDIDVKVGFDNNILQRQVTVEITQTVPIPFSGLFEYFGGEKFKFHAKTAAVISDPAEYIRNIDYGSEWLKRLFEKVKSENSDISGALKVINKWIKK